MKRIFAILLAAVMLLSLTACSKSKKIENGFEVEGKDAVELGTPDKTLDPQEVYNSLTYTEDMFHGSYRLLGGDEAEDRFAEEMDYIPVQMDDEEIMLSVLPYGFRNGPDTLSHWANRLEGYDCMEVHFMRKYANDYFGLDLVLCAYTVEGNTLTLVPFNSFSVNEETEEITYGFCDVEFTCEFSFAGRNLTLKAGDKSVTITTGLAGFEDTLSIVSGNSCRQPESPALDGIDEIFYYYDEDDNSSNFSVDSLDDEYVGNGRARFEDNGLVTITLPWERGTKTYQLVYIYCGFDGLILTDGETVYRYTADYFDRMKEEVQGNVAEEEIEKLDDLSESKMEELVEKKENLLQEFTEAFEAAGLNVSVNAQSGELALDASILFMSDSAELTDEGKDFLNRFLSVYTQIVFSEKYEGFVSKTVIEGHTALLANSTYESGLPLSTQRADAVKDYCLSGQTGVDTSALTASLEAVGLSNSYPIYDAQGNVDKAASRRVSFKFIIDLTQLG